MYDKALAASNFYFIIALPPFDPFDPFTTHTMTSFTPGYIQRTRSVCNETGDCFQTRPWVEGESQNRCHRPRVDCTNDDDDDDLEHAMNSRSVSIVASPAPGSKRSSPTFVAEAPSKRLRGGSNLAFSLGLKPDGGVGGRYKCTDGRDLYVNTITGTLLALDWDLTVDCVSTPYNKDVMEKDEEGYTVRDNVFKACGYSDEDKNDYMTKMWALLNRFVELRDNGHCDLVIVTRNTVSNVEAMIDACSKWGSEKLEDEQLYFTAEDFPIISYPENNVAEGKKMDKAQLLADHFPKLYSVDTVIFVDDSHGKSKCEHERFALSVENVFGHIKDSVTMEIEVKTKIHHVKVERCPRLVSVLEGSSTEMAPCPYGRQGLGNQEDKLDEIATYILGTDVKPEYSWQELCNFLDTENTLDSSIFDSSSVSSSDSSE